MQFCCVESNDYGEQYIGDIKITFFTVSTSNFSERSKLRDRTIHGTGTMRNNQVTVIRKLYVVEEAQKTRKVY